LATLCIRLYRQCGSAAKILAFGARSFDRLEIFFAFQVFIIAGMMI